MRRSLALPLLAGSLALAGCGASSGGSTPAAAPAAAPGSAAAAQPSPAQAAAAAPAAAAGALAISGYSYSPGALTVAAGQVVTVTNKDSVGHTVDSTTKGAFSSGNVDVGKPGTFTAPAKAGTYTYICAYHPKMHGTLIVTG